MSGRALRLMVIVSLLLVGGCANMSMLHSSQTTLLEDYRQVRSWSAVQTETGVRERDQLYAQEASGMNRLRLALALGFGKGAATDSKRALQLFDESAKAVGVMHSNEALFAEVFAGVLKERLQSEAKISAAEVKVNAAEAKSSAAETKISTLNRQVESERGRADELEKKLEALKSIEKSLRKR